MSQATGPPKFPLFAESETKSFLKVVDAQIDFLKDANGAVNRLVLHQGGHDIEAPRAGMHARPEAGSRREIAGPAQRGG